MAGIILRFGSYFAQMGVGSAIIQKESLTDEDVRAAFTSSALLGIVFSGLTFVFAPLGLYIFDSPHVIPVIRALGFSFLLSGLSTTALSMLRRRLDFRSQAIIDISSYVLGYGVVGVLLALMGLGVWSLVVASLSQAALTVVIAYLLARHSLFPSFQWTTHKRLFSFGGRLSVISFLEFIGFNVDTLVIGRVWGADFLGIYTRSYAIVMLPVQYLGTTVSKVLFPSFSQIQTETVRLRRGYYSAVMLLGVVVMPLSYGMIPAAKELVLTLLGRKWESGTSLLQILAVSVPFIIGTGLPGAICDSTGRLRAKLFLQLCFIALIGMFIGLTYRYGIELIAVAVVSANLVRFIAYQVLMRETLSITYAELLKAHLPGFVISIGVTAGIMLTRLLLKDLPSGLLLMVEVLIGGTIFLSFLLVKPPAVLRDVIREMLTRLDGATQAGSITGRVMNWYGAKILRLS